MAKPNAKQFNTLVARKSEIKFAEAKERAVVIELNKNHIIVVLQRIKIVFETNANFDDGISKKLEKFAIDKIILRPVYCCEHDCFANIGFEYDGVLYELDNYTYDTVYSYICSSEFDSKYVPLGLKDAAYELKTEIENLPEIEYCENATVDLTDCNIKIIYGPNVIYTYLNDCEIMQIGYKYDGFGYIPSQPIVGKCKGDYYLFLKIGRHTFKIDEICKSDVAEMYVHSHYKL